MADSERSPSADAEPRSDGAREPEQHESAAYIAAMCAELIAIADRAKLNTLCYFLDMAKAEAMFRSRPRGDAPPDAG